MDFSPSALAAGLLLSAVGFGLFRYGKAQTRMPQYVAGILMMIAPMFAGGWIGQLAVGSGLVGALWLAVRLGL